MSSTNPSPLFMPLHPSPRLVAQMTGLSLKQSELEVAQQHNLKRMLRRIRLSRQRGLGASPRVSRLVHGAKRPMPSLTLPAAVPITKEQDEEGWSDTEDDGLEFLRTDISMEIADNPSEPELCKRVASLFNNVFAPKTDILPNHVQVQRLSGAMTNCVYMVQITPVPQVLGHAPAGVKSAKQMRPVSSKGEPMPSKYLLRVYGIGVDEFLSREKELFWLRQLTSLGFGPKLYGVFGNGRLEEFLESTTLGKDDMRDPSTSKHIARRMCELHSLVSHYRPVAGHQQGTGLSVKTTAGFTSGYPELWTNIDTWMLLVARKWSLVRQACQKNTQCIGILDRWTAVEKALGVLRQRIQSSQAPVVFAHDDLQYGNILRLRDTGELAVVDFEYAGYNYRGFDIANHFCEWMADYHHPEHPHLLNTTQYPTCQQRAAFLRTYVRAKAFLDANMPADAQVVESETQGGIELREISLLESQISRQVEVLEKEVQMFVPASHLHWGVWSLLQACASEIDFDYVGYATQRLSLFLEQMSE